MDANPTFTAFREVLAEGKALAEIERLPKIFGFDYESGREPMQELLGGFDCESQFTDPETAMFVKLMDNSYRDPLVAIANQIGFTPDQLELDAYDAISMANYEYPGNGILTPGPLGGK